MNIPHDVALTEWDCSLSPAIVGRLPWISQPVLICVDGYVMRAMWARFGEHRWKHVMASWQTSSILSTLVVEHELYLDKTDYHHLDTMKEANTKGHWYRSCNRKAKENGSKLSTSVRLDWCTLDSFFSLLSRKRTGWRRAKKFSCSVRSIACGLRVAAAGASLRRGKLPTWLAPETHRWLQTQAGRQQ